MKKYLAELIGSFILVFCGTGAIVINEVTKGSVSHVGIAITFGLTVAIIIYSIGEISGAHINPAVSLTFFIKKELSGKDLGIYIISQLMGAILASITLKLLFPSSEYLGSTLPAGSPMQSFIIEIILSFILMFTITQVGKKELAGMIIGSVVGLEAMFAGPITGASMNPARSIAPALLSGHVESLWIYIAAPIIGCLLGYLSSKAIRNSAV